ncbi:hypothetical protein [Streptomyces sp. H39-S7]|uniref:hypothetical protein n=1 Tax=Streptomyces sp. H39-S7 TaxID=3004357 RepID=UPI0022AEF259|nr:hypothetical protein [Streptomyces sp. H39-S7]MCZ4125855.1 hypothetical protein [Streptomyces sp. H39-S7]
MTTGLRALKKRQTRQAVSDAVQSLFLERSFEAATISEIAAAAAPVAKMTVANDFPRKEDRALDFHEAFRERLGLRGGVSRARGDYAPTALRREYPAGAQAPFTRPTRWRPLFGRVKGAGGQTGVGRDTGPGGGAVARERYEGRARPCGR